MKALKTIRFSRTVGVPTGLAALIYLFAPGLERGQLAGTPKAHAASVILGGARLTCGRGVVAKNHIKGNLGAATRGRIYLDRKGLSKLPRAVQIYVFLHECGHQYMRGEADADCWAVKRGKYRGLLTARSIDTICKTVSRWSGSDVHPPGPARCAYMRRCFREGPGRK